MPKPPRSTPHSDLSGVHEDRAHVIGAANAAGQDAGDLDQARKKNAARPDPSSDEAEPNAQ